MSAAPHFNNRLEVVAFIQQRIKDKHLDRVAISRAMGFANPASFAHMLSGRRRISASKGFQQLCQLLDITPGERQAIWHTEHGAHP